MPISTNPVAVTEPNYPRETWWVAATSTEIGTRPVQRWILGLPVVLYRRADGNVVALDDRCAHRWAPLSRGQIEGDDIACPYHGFRFGPDGRCTHIPTQKVVPNVVRVRSYPVREQAPFVWVYTGSAEGLVDAEPPAELDWAVDPIRVTASGAMEVACNFMAIHENVLDLSHFPIAHAATLGVTDWTRPPKVEKTNNTVDFLQRFDATPLPAHYGVPTGIGCERPATRINWGRYISPALHCGGVDIEDPNPAPGGRTHFNLKVLHAVTPMDAGRTRYWWFFSQDYGHGEGAVERGRLLWVGDRHGNNV